MDVETVMSLVELGLNPWVDAGVRDALRARGRDLLLSRRVASAGVRLKPCVSRSGDPDPRDALVSWNGDCAEPGLDRRAVCLYVVLEIRV